MNYRHAYHAGNFSDVLKHVVLVRVLSYLKLKAQPFRVIDTHAGAGRYDLRGVEAQKTAEWRDGIERLVDADMDPEVADLLAPYLDAVKSVSPPGELIFYPGSPLIALSMMRSGDTLLANELHLDDFAVLRRELRKAANAKVLNLDAWLAVKSLLPPPERRGLILIDPPFEKPDEFDRLADAVRDGLARFATGVFLIWYPVKDEVAADHFLKQIADLGCPNIIDVRFSIAASFPGLGLTQTGIVILNGPFKLEAELRTLLPFLVERLGQGRGAGFQIENRGEAAGARD